MVWKFTVNSKSEMIKLGISKCLLGEKVRYDGQHKLDRFLRDELGVFVEWESICPEVECGLPVPREAMDLYGDPENPELISTNGKNLSYLMKTWVKQKLVELEKFELSGFIFKNKSPSCGLYDTKLYTFNTELKGKTSGIFAKAFVKKYPLLPVVDEESIHDSVQRDNFVERVFVYSRWQNELKQNCKNWLIDFHKNHKLIIMSHAPSKTAELGRIASNTKKYSQELFNNYIFTLMKVLKETATVKRNVNVLQHIFGYFKNDLTSWEKKELLSIINDYYNELVPIIVPLTLLKHYIEKYKKNYLKKQYYLYPHPIEVKLRY